MDPSPAGHACGPALPPLITVPSIAPTHEAGLAAPYAESGERPVGHPPPALSHLSWGGIAPPWEGATLKEGFHRRRLEGGGLRPLDPYRVSASNLALPTQEARMFRCHPPPHEPSARLVLSRISSHALAAYVSARRRRLVKRPANPMLP